MQATGHVYEYRVRVDETAEVEAKQERSQRASWQGQGFGLAVVEWLNGLERPENDVETHTWK